MSDLTKRECAIRAAAIIDTDGSIDINKLSTNYAARCAVSNNDLRLLNWLKNVYGGSICESSNRRHKDGYKRRRSYKWTVTAQKAELFLRQIAPFLIIKQKQAYCALGLRMEKGYHTRQISPQEKQTMWRPYYDRMRKLNNKDTPHE